MIQNSLDTPNPKKRHYTIVHAKVSMEKSNIDPKGCINDEHTVPSIAYISKIAMAHESNSNDARVNNAAHV